MRHHTSRGKITIINAYAPHSQITKKDINQTENIYNILSDHLKRNTRSTFISEDFYDVIANSNKYYPKNIGSYSKGTTNENGPLLIDFIIQNNLYATNAFFKHLYTNITTWQKNNYPAH